MEHNYVSPEVEVVHCDGPKFLVASGNAEDGPTKFGIWEDESNGQNGSY